MSTITLSCFNKYPASPQSHWFDNTADGASIMERMLMTAQYGTALVAQMNRFHGNEEQADRLQNVSDTFGSGRTILGIIRAIFPIEQLLSQKMFYQRYTQDDVRDNPGTFIQVGAFKKVALDVDGKIYYTLDDFDNKVYTYVSENEDGVYLRRDWLDILCDILVLAARILSPLTWLNKFKAINLGRHAGRISNAISGLWSVIISLNLVSSGRTLIQAARWKPQDEKQTKKFKEKVVDTIASVFDVAAIAFDVFGAAAAKSTRRELALTGSIICTLAPLTTLAKKIYFA